MGVRVSGKSAVLHELDVCVLDRTEAQTCRSGQAHPRHSKVRIGVECKFYTSHLSLALARSFLGLGVDMTARATFFVTNSESRSVEKLLSARNRNWESLLFPGSTVAVERMRNQFQDVFKNYKAL